ncbi:mechanosensitive ion channel family protein [Candidatus Solincola tengchongensis]|uniref:mechanosensitive ion channel family protein n=1 Tax=Candidatus Solincola tengchongensis TaxID=2900693 RepID=UPI00257BCE38|nr:mechanosensitive ion channel family protein [Candidatus Solincola tengchongensis]
MMTANVVLDAFRDLWEGFMSRLPSLAVGLVVLLFFYLLARAVRFLVSHSIMKVRASEHAARVVSRLAFTGILALGVLVALGVMGVNPGALVASLGLVSVGIGFALKDVIENFIAGITIILQRPFVIGDGVRFGDVEGVVEDVRVRDTVIRMFDGRKVFVPNRSLFSGVVINSTVNRRRRLDFKVGVAYAADLTRAAAVAEKALRALDGVLDEPPPLVVLEGLGENSVELRVFFWLDPTTCDPLQVKSRAISAVKAALEKEGITIPEATA